MKSEPRKPLLSVVIPMMDERGYGLRCLRAWNEQNFPRKDFEVIALVDGSRPGFSRKVQTLLRPWDSFIQQPADDEMVLYDLGCRAAASELILITEGHVVPEPSTAAELVRFFETAECDAAMLASDSVMRGSVARMEDRDFALWWKSRSDPGDWRRVTLRGLAIRRQALEEAGGLRPEFGRFAETALAFEMRRQGKSLGFAALSKVHHVNSASFAEMAEAILSCARGQILFRLEVPSAQADAFLGIIPLWSQRTLFHRPIARRLLADQCKLLLLDVGRRGYAAKLARGLRAVTFFSRNAFFGLGLRLTLTRLRLAWFKARFHLPTRNEESRYRCFRQVWNGLFDLGYMLAMKESPRAFALRGGSRLDYPASEIPDHWLAGFHRLRNWDGKPCRWSRPTALIRLPVPRGDYRVRLDVRSPVPLSQCCLRLFFNGRSIPRSAIVEEDDALTFALHSGDFVAGDEQRLTITCRPCPQLPQVPQADSGLALLGMRLEPGGFAQRRKRRRQETGGRRQEAGRGEFGHEHGHERRNRITR